MRTAFPSGDLQPRLAVPLRLESGDGYLRSLIDPTRLACQARREPARCLAAAEHLCLNTRNDRPLLLTRGRIHEKAPVKGSPAFPLGGEHCALPESTPASIPTLMKDRYALDTV